MAFGDTLKTVGDHPGPVGQFIGTTTVPLVASPGVTHLGGLTVVPASAPIGFAWHTPTGTWTVVWLSWSGPTGGEWAAFRLTTAAAKLFIRSARGIDGQPIPDRDSARQVCLASID